MRHQTPETLRASQSERDTSVPCCLYLSEDSNALAYRSRHGERSPPKSRWEESCRMLDLPALFPSGAVQFPTQQICEQIDKQELIVFFVRE